MPSPGMKVNVVCTLLIAAGFWMGCTPAQDTAVSARQGLPSQPAQPQGDILSARDTAPAPSPSPASAPPAMPSPEALARSRTLLDVTFKEINKKGYPILSVRNTTDKDIDTIRGSFRMEDASGKLVFASAHSDTVEGLVFAKVGETILLSPYGLGSKAELVQQLRENPKQFRFSFEVLAITYMDGTSGP